MFLFIFSAYGVYYLIGDFIDYLILGYIAGLAYHQTRGRFIKIIMDSRSYDGHSKPLYQRLLKALGLVIFILVLPRLRVLLSNPLEIYNALKLNECIMAFEHNRNLTVIICQIFAGLYSFYLIIGPYLKKIGQKLRPTKEACVKWSFGFLVLVFTISIIALIPTVLFKEIGQVGFLIE